RNFSVLKFDLGAPQLPPAASGDQIQVTGNLTLDGNLDITDTGGFGVGTYTLMTYTGTLTNNTLNLRTVPSGFFITLDTATSGQVNLVVRVPVDHIWTGLGADTNWNTAGNWMNNSVPLA